jgi:hypothetical protein
MPELNKPAITQDEIWANSAAAIEKVKPVQTKIDSGWAYAEKPLHSALNWALSLLTSFVAYINEKGMPEWDAATEYFTDSFVKVGPVIYVALTGSTNKEPTASPAEWASYQQVSSIATLTVNSPTPSISGAASVKTANTTATTITGLVGGVEGQRISIYINDAFTTIAGTMTKTGMTIPLIVGDVLEFYYNGTSWKQIAGTVGMGQWVPLFNESLGVLAYQYPLNTSVSLTSDGVRKGAVSVVGWFEFMLHNTETLDLQTNIRCRLSAGTDPSFDSWIDLVKSAGNIVSRACNIMLTDDATFILDFSTSTGYTFGTRTLNLSGYYI